MQLVTELHNEIFVLCTVKGLNMKTILFTFREKYGFDIEFVSATSIEDAWIILAGMVDDVSEWEMQGGIK